MTAFDWCFGTMIAAVLLYAAIRYILDCLRKPPLPPPARRWRP